MRYSSLIPVVALLAPVLAQDSDDGYIGYEFEKFGDEESTNYETANTKDDPLELSPIPDVYLNASLHVGEINIEVDNITAKVNLDAKVLNLLHFTAGVSASVDRVRLNIQNVTAKVELEARLENVVGMIGDVLDTIDANPIIATLGRGIGDIVGNVTDGIGGGGGDDSGSDGGSGGGDEEQEEVPEEEEGGSRKKKRSAALQFKLDNNILYSVNNFEGNTNRNRILAQNGSLIDSFLNNQGKVSREKVVGFYSRDMTFTGHNRTIEEEGSGGEEDEDKPKKVKEFELQYIYKPYPGLEAVSNIYVNTEGQVVRTQVIAEAEGGGTATLAENPDL